MKKLFVIAGEPSGDVLGSAIIRGLRRLRPDLHYIGIGGPLMEQEGGFNSLVPLETLSHMGLWNIIKNLPQLRSVLNGTFDAIQAQQPSGLLTIDSPEFSLRLSRRVRNIPRIHCNPPTVWAWRPGRARRLAKYTDHILSLFPFEADYFKHMSYTFVGHPVCEMPLGKAKDFWIQHKIEPSSMLALLPGSRLQEIKRLMPIFLKTLERLQKILPYLQAFIACPPSLKQAITDFAPPCPIITDEQEKRNAFAASKLALCASGSVTLELAKQDTPMIIVYQVAPLTGWFLKKMISIPYVGLINILAYFQRTSVCVPECLQENCTPDVLTAKVLDLLTDPHILHQQRMQFYKVLPYISTEQSFEDASATAIARILDQA